MAKSRPVNQSIKGNFCFGHHVDRKHSLACPVWEIIRPSFIVCPCQQLTHNAVVENDVTLANEYTYLTFDPDVAKVALLAERLPDLRRGCRTTKRSFLTLICIYMYIWVVAFFFKRGSTLVCSAFGFLNKHCQRHYGPRRWLLWPVILVR